VTVRAGVAVVDITPPIGVAMSGFAARREPADAVHDALSARAVAVDDGSGASLIVVADLVAVTIDQADELRTTIAERTGLDQGSITVSVTHTHGGPQVTPDALGPTAAPVAIERAAQGIVDAAVDAWRDRSPARLRWGTAVEPGVASNRRVPGGAVDPTVRVVAIDDPDGRPRAVVFTHACHPVVLGADNLALTADWPGDARATIERARPGTVAVFLQGCCGQVNTGHSAHESMSRAASPIRTFAECARVGDLVGRAALRALDGATPSTGPIGSTATPVELPFDRVEPDALAGKLARWEAALPAADEQQRIVLDGKVEWARRFAGRGPSALTAAVGAHRWGDIVIVTLPGEPFLGFATDIAAGLDRPATMVLGYSNGVPGYLPYPPAEYAAGGYEVDEAHCFYGQPHRFAPSCGPALVAAGIDTARRLLPPTVPLITG